MWQNMIKIYLSLCKTISWRRKSVLPFYPDINKRVDFVDSFFLVCFINFNVTNSFTCIPLFPIFGFSPPDAVSIDLEVDWSRRHAWETRDVIRDLWEHSKDVFYCVTSRPTFWDLLEPSKRLNSSVLTRRSLWVQTSRVTVFFRCVSLSLETSTCLPGELISRLITSLMYIPLFSFLVWSEEWPFFVYLSGEWFPLYTHHLLVYFSTTCSSQ